MVVATLEAYCRLCEGAKVLNAAVRPICSTAFAFLVAWEPVAVPEREHIRLQSLLTKAQHPLVLKPGTLPLDTLCLFFLPFLVLSSAIHLHCPHLWRLLCNLPYGPSPTFDSTDTLLAATRACVFLSTAGMGVYKQVLKEGNGAIFPKKHDEVTMEYTGSTAFPIPLANISRTIQAGSTTKAKQTRRETSESYPRFYLQLWAK